MFARAGRTAFACLFGWRVGSSTWTAARNFNLRPLPCAQAIVSWDREDRQEQPLLSERWGVHAGACALG